MAAVTLATRPWCRVAGAVTATESRAVSGFDEVEWRGVGELAIEQTGHERLSIEAEPAVLAMVAAEVRRRRLSIGFLPGSFQTQEPVRFRLEVISLTRLDTQGSGAIRIGPLTTPDLALQLAGSGELHLAHLSARTLRLRLDGSVGAVIDGGEVESQRITLTGSGRCRSPRLASRRADIDIEGSGSVEIAASEQLSVQIAGSGRVVYLGDPRVSTAVRGSGTVRRSVR